MSISLTSKLAPVRHRLPRRAGANPFEASTTLGVSRPDRTTPRFRSGRANGHEQPQRLADGIALVRYADTADAEQLTRFYESLDAESRYRRFLQATPRITPAMAEHVLTPPNSVLVALDHGGDIVAEAVFAPARRAGAAAEVAYAVGGAFRRRGLARSMVCRVLADAARDGVSEVEAMIGGDNAPSVALMRSFGATLSVEDGIVTARLELTRTP
jgi:RimJ/RimL family protein N-acetyltransferase